MTIILCTCYRSIPQLTLILLKNIVMLNKFYSWWIISFRYEFLGLSFQVLFNLPIIITVHFLFLDNYQLQAFDNCPSPSLSHPKPDTRICDHDRHANIKHKPDINKNQLNFFQNFYKNFSLSFHSCFFT